jgi:hypothetical protein
MRIAPQIYAPQGNFVSRVIEPSVWDSRFSSYEDLFFIVSSVTPNECQGVSAHSCAKMVLPAYKMEAEFGFSWIAELEQHTAYVELSAYSAVGSRPAHRERF